MYQGNIYRLAVFVLLIGWLAVALWVAGRNVRGASEPSSVGPQETLASDLSDVTAHNEPSVPKSTLEDVADSVAGSRDAGGLFVATIRRPDGPPRIDSGVVDPQGRSGTIACSTCHSVREPNFANRSPADLDQFHQGMAFSHGSTTCYSCHHPDDADSLRLADSTKVQYVDVMTLCAQCHGPQYRDYLHGAHGGMNGYWDLTRGPQTRNNCIDCHDPHVPAFPKMQPTFKPRDRFLSPPADDAHGAAVEKPLSQADSRAVNDSVAELVKSFEKTGADESLDDFRYGQVWVAELVKSFGGFCCGANVLTTFATPMVNRSVRDPAAYASRLTEDCDDPIRILNQRWAV